MLIENIDLRIRAVLRSKKMTMRQLCKDIGMTENGLASSFKKNTIKLETLEKIASTLDMQLYELIFSINGNNTLSKESEAFFLIQEQNAKQGFSISYPPSEEEIEKHEKELLDQKLIEFHNEKVSALETIRDFLKEENRQLVQEIQNQTISSQNKHINFLEKRVSELEKEVDELRKK